MAVAWQPSFFDLDEPALAPDVEVTRTWLDERTWVDHGPGWLQGAGHLLEQLTAQLPWEQRTRVLWDEERIEPRLTAEPPMPLPGVLDEAARRLGERYGVTFDWCWCNLYRDGRDSVAWHRDRIHRTHVDPLVVTLSLGQRRPFLLRPRGGGRSVRFDVGGGDLIVMGGACQHTWEHSVPKVAGGCGPRLSVTLRHSAPHRPPAVLGGRSQP